MPMITRIVASGRRCGLLFIVVGAACFASGCSTTRARPQWVESITFWEKRETDDRYLKRTPAEEIEDLRVTMEKVPSMTPEEQNAKASELAEAYRNESDPLVRLEMLRVVARCGSPAAAETLKAAMGDSDREVRVTACQAWGVHGGPLAVPQLSEALRKDVSVDVRLAAGKALGQIGGDEAVKALAVALDDQDPALQYRAIQSLREITGKDFGDNVVAWRDYTRGSGTPTEISMMDRMKLKAF
jgi:hypothetical protein